MEPSSSSSKTGTQQKQADLESLVGSLYGAFESATNKERSVLLSLHHDEHEDYVYRGLKRLGVGYSALDASRPWLCYWILHSLALLGRSVDEDLYERIIQFLERCQDRNGGYGGGPGQMPHLATTYAATCALVTLGGERALSSINRKTLLQFLLRMKEPCGGFRVHENGEMDTRGSYTVMAVAHMLDIVVPPLIEKVGEYVRSCQTYEGGIAGEPGAEAHGGYTFCGLAAVTLIDEIHVLDLPSLVNWVVFRQGKVEGGFQGRTNKLVDGCYSFWQGGCFRILQQQKYKLWMQQIATTAATSTSRHGASGTPTVANSSPPGVPERQNDSDRDFEVRQDRQTHADGESSSVAGVQQAGLESQSYKVNEAASGPEAEANPGAISFESDMRSEQRDVEAAANAEADFHSPSKQWDNEEDDVEYWDSSSQDAQAAAENLFPMPRGDFRVGPLQQTRAELVELDDDEQETEATEACCSTTETPTPDFDGEDDILDGPIFNSQALQAYILLCCQDLDGGGLRDKPGKPCDYYHSCYCLSGLSAAQHSTAHRIGAPPPSSGVVGPYSNLVEETHAVCNVRLDRFNEARSYFKRMKDRSWKAEGLL